jgi:hypothetical protein
VVCDGPCFWAAPVERDGEFGGRGFPTKLPAEALIPRTKDSARESTTLAVVVTDAVLTKPQAERLAVMAQTGLARAIYPVHAPLDGDILLPPPPGRSHSPIPYLRYRTLVRSQPTRSRAPSMRRTRCRLQAHNLARQVRLASRPGHGIVLWASGPLQR